MLNDKNDHDTMRVHNVGSATLAVNHVGYRDGRPLYDVTLRGNGQVFQYQRGMPVALLGNARHFTNGENAQRMLDWELRIIGEAFNPTSQIGVSVTYPAWVDDAFNGNQEGGQ